MNKLDESGKARLNWAREGIRNRPQLLSRLMNFFFVLMNCNAEKNNCKNKQCSKSNKKKVRSLHLFYSPLSKNIASPKMMKNIANPQMNKTSLNLSAETIGHNTTIAKIILVISKRFLEISNFWRLLNSIIKNILGKIKMFVKQLVVTPET